MDKNLEIIVSSCDLYEDLWDPFFLLFERYWKDCPYNVHLITNNIEPSEGSSASNIVKKRGGVIQCGNKNWAQRMFHALEKVKSEYVILLCEDFLICDSVDNNKISNCLSLVAKYNAGVLYMGGNLDNPFVSRKQFSMDENLMEYMRGSAYRIFVTPGIWKVSYLRRLIESGCNSIWDFEKKVSFISNNFDEPVIGCDYQMFPFEYGVFRGKWEYAGVRLCNRCRINIDFNKREMMNNLDYCKKYFKGAILNLSPTLITKISNLINMGR